MKSTATIKMHSILANGEKVDIGLLLIPRRPDAVDAAQFRQDAPASANGKIAYRKGQIYLRQGDSSRPAEASEDYSFLCSPDRRHIIDPGTIRSRIALDNNLGPRDPGFIKFVGREEYLQSLWKWMCDPFSPVKLLSGIGGVGKTTIAREFVEDVVATPPAGLERVIWLSAKQQLFTAILGKYQSTSRLDFTDTCTLLQSILRELGYPDKTLNPEWSRDDLIQEVVQALKMFPCLIVVDDIDSLAPEHQHDAFHSMIRIVDQTLGGTTMPSRALLTARLDLGAAPSQLVRVRGLNLDDFAEYVQMTADSHGMAWQHKPNAPIVKRFHEVTDGSPTFAASILRLVSRGSTLDQSLSRWKGADGESVRRFAFERELEHLTGSQLRTLYAACILGDTSALELQQILQSNEVLINDDIGALRNYHLVVSGSDLPGGAGLRLPSSIRLLADIVKGRIHDPKSIERECEKVRHKTPAASSGVGHLTTRVMALWKSGQYQQALEVAQLADQRYADHADVKCLLGRAYLRLPVPDPQKAEAALHSASKLGCSRPELITLWMEAKKQRKDWVGLLEITKGARGGQFITARATAYAELADIALKSNNLDRAARHCQTGAEEAHAALEHQDARGREREARQWRQSLWRAYVNILDQHIKSPGDRLAVWQTCLQMFRHDAGDVDLLVIAVRNLGLWWSAVEKREEMDAKANEMMLHQLRAANRMIGDERAKDSEKDSAALIETQRVLSELHARVNLYGRNRKNDSQEMRAP
ncbi:MAG: AAA family ATPase [Candidatus Sulfotelmatobacter sp.]